MIDTDFDHFKEIAALLTFVEREYEQYYELLAADNHVIWVCKITKTLPKNNTQIEYEETFKQNAKKVFS